MKVMIKCVPSVVSSSLRRALRPVRRCCLPLLSLSRTPGGRYFEWSIAFFDPCLAVFERSVWLIGLVCFMLVLLGISSVVWSMYVYTLPFLWLVQHPAIFLLYVLYGHYLLINICFHYFKGVYTSPGYAPKVPGFDPNTTELRRGWKYCCKCDAPKPPRAHHCRICNKCVLKMDHHCPWMFNCIGHCNHRHFILFLVFMWLGTAYVVNCSWTRVAAIMGFRSEILDVIGLGDGIRLAASAPAPVGSESTFVILIFFICFGVTIALSLLGGCHLWLVSFGETTIEFHLNKREARSMKQEGRKFHNEYHYGCWKNWLVLLGIANGRSFLWRVLLPSSHRPSGDGMDWDREAVFGLLSTHRPRTIPV